MSEYSRRNLACSSHHRCPEGWRSWSGMVHGYTFRPFCELGAGHAGDHEAGIETIERETSTPIQHIDVDGKDLGTWDELVEAHETMTWTNTLGIPPWLVQTTRHGLMMLTEHRPDLVPLIAPLLAAWEDE